MSVIKVNKIESTGTTAGGVEVDSSGHVQVDGVQMPTAGVLSNRNLIINGAMQVSQRATQVTGVTTSGYNTCDRIHLAVGTLGTWTVDQSTDAPDGFANSFKVTCTTADASPAAADVLAIIHRIEAQNLQHLKFGTSPAESLTLSFWVKSNKTGAASFDMYQPDASNRQISKSYTISSANTWEYKTVTLPGDAAGAFNNDNGIGLVIDFWLNSGSNYSSGSHQTTWGGLIQTSRNASNLGVGGAVSDHFAITGVQLEVAEKAPPFEHRSFGDELARCQRYFEKQEVYQFSGAPVSSVFHVIKRASPTLTFTGAATINVQGTSTYSINSGSSYTSGIMTASAEL